MSKATKRKKSVRIIPAAGSVATAEAELMTDGELCESLRISRVTLRKHLPEGPSRGRYGSDVEDVRTIRHIKIGGHRRWIRSEVHRFIHGE
jgi:hypothetical protein